MQSNFLIDPFSSECQLDIQKKEVSDLKVHNRTISLLSSRHWLPSWLTALFTCTTLLFTFTLQCRHLTAGIADRSQRWQKVRFLPNIWIKGMNFKFRKALIMFDGMKAFRKAAPRNLEILYYVTGLPEWFLSHFSITW